MVNVAFGSALVYMARNKQYSIMFGVAAFIMATIFMKIIFACLYWLKAKNDRRRANNTIRTRSSDVFSDINQNAYGENAFETYGNAIDSGIILRSYFDSEANGGFKTSVESKDILMGFDLRKEHDKQTEIIERFSRRSDRARFSYKSFGKLNKKKYEENKSTNDLSIKESDSYDEQDQSEDYDAIEDSKTIDKNVSISEEDKTNTKQLSNDSKSVEDDDIHIEMENSELDRNSNQKSSYSSEVLIESQIYKHTKEKLSSFYENERESGDSSFEASSDD